MEKDPFKEYLRESEPDKAHKGYAWSTAIGLQAVDGLKPSKYLIDTAIQNIEGKITMKEAQSLIDSYYEERPVHLSDDERTEEADKVSSRIAEILSETAFSFSPNEYISIHRKLFRGIYKHAGKIRDYNITKKEWVLDGATVMYGSASELRATLEYDFSQEKDFSYKGLSMDEIIHHLAVFVSRLWQIHIFGEGNTRTTAVFFIKYLRTLGFSATNDIFAENAWYFRNALVRANYTNLQKGIHETTEYLEVFLRNLLRLYIRRTGSNSKCISSDNYTSAVKKELQQLSTFSQIKEIRDKELNSVILSHLEMSEDLVEGIKSEWEQKKIFKKQIKGDDGTTLIEDSYCTRSYVREIILRYCQNRTFFRTKFNIKDGNLF